MEWFYIFMLWLNGWLMVLCRSCLSLMLNEVCVQSLIGFVVIVAVWLLHFQHYCLCHQIKSFSSLSVIYFEFDSYFKVLIYSLYNIMSSFLFPQIGSCFIYFHTIYGYRLDRRIIHTYGTLKAWSWRSVCLHVRVGENRKSFYGLQVYNAYLLWSLVPFVQIILHLSLLLFSNLIVRMIIIIWIADLVHEYAFIYLCWFWWGEWFWTLCFVLFCFKNSYLVKSILKLLKIMFDDLILCQSWLLLVAVAFVWIYLCRIT